MKRWRISFSTDAVRGDLDEVVFLAWVGFEVEELLDLVLRPVDVFPVLAYQGLGLGDEVFIPDAGVLVEKLAAPDRFLIGQIKWCDVLALACAPVLRARRRRGWWERGRH